MSAAEEARRWADLAGQARVAEPPTPRTGLENREVAPPGAETCEEFFARVAAARLLHEDAE